MTPKLVISDRAHDDIVRNAVWWARNHSKGEAWKWMGAVYEQIESIPQMPESYSLAPENPKFSYEIRQKNVGLGPGGYRAVFTVRGEELHVLTVRSGSQRLLTTSDVT